MINKLVAKKEEEREERRRSSTQAAVATEASRRWQLAALKTIEDGRNEAPSPHDAQSIAARVTKSGSSTPERKKMGARDRLAEIQREADERKRAALAVPMTPSTAESFGTASQVGTAQAAAKLAGGVFYTRDEHVSLPARAAAPPPRIWMPPPRLPRTTTHRNSRAHSPFAHHTPCSLLHVCFTPSRCPRTSACSAASATWSFAGEAGLQGPELPPGGGTTGGADQGAAQARRQAQRKQPERADRAAEHQGRRRCFFELRYLL